MEDPIAGERWLNRPSARGLAIASAVTAAAIVIWVAWAQSLLPAQRAVAELAYFDQMRTCGDIPPAWNRPVEIKSAHARPVGVSNYFPPGFEFEVSLEASVGGLPRRDVGRVIFGGRLYEVRAVSFGDSTLLEDRSSE